MAFLYMDARQDMEAQQRRISQHAAWVAARFETTLQECEQEFALLLRQMANGAPLREPSGGDCFRVVEVLSTQGAVLESWQDDQAVSARWWRRTAGETPGGGLSVLVGSEASDPPHLALAARADEASGRILVAELRLDALRRELTEYASLMGVSLQLSDDADQVAKPAVPIRGTTLSVGVEAESGHGVAGWVKRLRLALTVGSLAVPFAVMLARWVGGRLRGHLLPMIRVSERIAKGDRGARVGELLGFAPLELHEIAGSLNHLADRFFETRDALVTANQSLEASVNARTEELAQRTVDLGYSRATLYAVMESMNDGLVLTTPDRRIRYINRNTEEMLNLADPIYPGQAADGLYQVVTDRCACEDLPEDQIAAALIDPERSPVLTTTSAGGGKRYLRWRTFSISNALGTHLGLGHLLTDVTQEHEVDRVKSELISIVSHELRTPLTAIRASVSSLLRPNVEWDDETRLDFLVTIFEESGHLQELIENLLDMSKIEAGMLRLDREPVSVERLIESVQYRAQVLHPDRSLSVLVAPGLPTVRIDARRMEQVLLNLIDNAVKYASESPTIEVMAQRRGTELWLMVRDHGPGIPQEHIQRIFDRFHRVDSTLTRNTGGNGLGLAICRGIVEGHGGRIWAESDPGKGSTIYVALPIAQEDADGEA